MTSYYKISAYNTQAIIVWGDAADAERYVDWLNRDREINAYSATEIPESEWADYEGRDDVMSMCEPYWDDFMADADA